VLAPAGVIDRVEGEVPVERATETTVFRVDAPSSEGAAPRFQLHAREIEAALRVHGERAAEGVQSEDGIGAGDDVDIGDGRLGDQIPVDRLSEAVIEAHAVKVHREAYGTAGERRGKEAPIREVVLPGIALAGVGVDGSEVPVEEVRDIEQVLVLDQFPGGDRLDVAGVLVDRSAKCRHRRGVDDHDRG
jgi:hypothetical protein